MLSSHLRLGLPRIVFTRDFPTKYVFFPYTIYDFDLVLLNFIIQVRLDECSKLNTICIT